MKILSIFLLCAQLGSSAGQEPNPVAKNRVQSLYTFQGCYEDRSERAMTHRIYGPIPVEECMEKCVALGYHYFGLQYTMNCWCSGQDKNDRGFARYGKKSDGCSCDSKSNVGGWLNCVYRAWPKQSSSYLPETACMTPSSEEKGAEIDISHCGSGGLNVYYYTNKNEVKHSSNLCVEMKVIGNKMRLVLNSCNGKDNQKFEVMNDCTNGVCGSAIGSGFSGECSLKGDCKDAKIWNYDVTEAGSHINVASCSNVKALDSNAPNGQYNFDGHDGDYTFCDYNGDRRIKTQMDSNFCLVWYVYSGWPTVRACNTFTSYNKFAIRANGIVKAYGIHIDKCLYVDSYSNGQEVKQGPCLNIQHEIKFQWYIDNFGHIKPKGAPHMCMDIVGGSVYNLPKIVIWGCHGGLNQRWLF